MFKRPSQVHITQNKTLCVNEPRNYLDFIQFVKINAPDGVQVTKVIKYPGPLKLSFAKDNKL